LAYRRHVIDVDVQPLRAQWTAFSTPLLGFGPAI
jgi:hypothetical protein